MYFRTQRSIKSSTFNKALLERWLIRLFSHSISSLVMSQCVGDVGVSETFSASFRYWEGFAARIICG